MRVLVLNASYEFLGFCDWQSAICMKVSGKVVVEEEYNHSVSSPSVSIKIPAVIRLKQYVHVLYNRVMFVPHSKRNVHLRDNYTCQYCGHRKKDGMGIDHVFPQSRGGESTWENTVSCCHPCNSLKGSRTPAEAGMRLRRAPVRPHGLKEVLRIKIGVIHDLWAKYL